MRQDCDFMSTLHNLCYSTNSHKRAISNETFLFPFDFNHLILLSITDFSVQCKFKLKTNTSAINEVRYVGSVEIRMETLKGCCTAEICHNFRSVFKQLKKTLIFHISAVQQGCSISI